MRTTIKDIAREAGVSVSTVSYALSKYARDGKVTKDSHQRILETVAKYNYVPDATARSLVKGRTNSIGVILPPDSTLNFRNPFFMQMLAALSDILADKGYWLSLHMPKGLGGGFMRRFLEDAKIDGMIWLVHPIPQEMEGVLESRRLPHVTIEYGTEFTHNGSAVLMDDYAGIRSALDYLYSLGHREILFLSGFDPDEDVQGRTGACLRRAADLTGCSVRVLYGYYTEKAAYNAINSHLAINGLDFSGVLAASDLMALGAMHAFADMGIAIPGQVSVMGFDDIPAAAEVEPGLTTMAQPLERMMRVACDHLIGCIDNGTSDGGMKCRILPELVVRGSVAKVEIGP